MRQKITTSLAATGLLLVLGVLAGAGCGPPPPDAVLPSGALFAGRREALDRLLATLASLEEVPLARHARGLRARLPDCPLLEARAPEGGIAALAAELGCSEAGAGPLRALHARRERDGSDLALVWPMDRGRAVILARAGADGALRLSARLPEDGVDGPAALLVPGAEPAGPPLLASADALVHARLRPAGGLDLQRFVAAGGQGDLLFRLKSDLFAGAVLDGTWEAAVYLPPDPTAAPDAEHPSGMPPAALAVGFSHRSAAVSAMEAFVDELRATWPVARVDFAVGDAAGACLPDLRILPGFAPCYVATERALVLGWNPASVRRALRPARGPAAAELPSAGGAVVRLDRFPVADRRVARLVGTGEIDAAPGVTLPWRRLLVQPVVAEGAVHVEAALEPAP